MNAARRTRCRHPRHTTLKTNDTGPRSRCHRYVTSCQSAGSCAETSLFRQTLVRASRIERAASLGQRKSRAQRSWCRRKKGTGFVQPLQPHEHWHVDVSYLNIAGTFYFLCSILDGCSRYLVHWEIRKKMEEKDVETILQRGREKFPGEQPRIITHGRRIVDGSRPRNGRRTRNRHESCGPTRVTPLIFARSNNSSCPSAFGTGTAKDKTARQLRNDRL